MKWLKKNLKMKIFYLKILSLNYKTYKIQNKIWKKKIIKNNNFKFLKLIITWSISKFCKNNKIRFRIMRNYSKIITILLKVKQMKWID